jgi:uncharacterized protein
MRKHRSAPVLRGLEMRSTDDGHSLVAYAAVFDSDSRPLGGGRFVETVAPGAFARTLQAPPNGRQTLVIDHDDARIIGATNGVHPLRLAEDATGLYVEAPRLPDTTEVRDLRELADAGLVSGMSFEFLPTDKGVQVSDGGKRRCLTDVRLYHVTALTGKTPAYPATAVEIRALAASAGVPFDLLSTAMEAVHDGRTLVQEEWRALEAAVTAIAPPESRWSVFAAHAAGASYTLADLLYQLASEEPSDGPGAQLLKTATEAVTAYIAAKSAAVGSDEDKAASGQRAATPNLDAARALITSIAGR